jgi:hypothetical protein
LQIFHGISNLLGECGALPREQIGDYKVTRHRQFMQDWVIDHPEIAGGRGFEEVWQIREACIAALAQ